MDKVSFYFIAGNFLEQDGWVGILSGAAAAAAAALRRGTPTDLADNLKHTSYFILKVFIVFMPTNEVFQNYFRSIYFLS